MSSVKCEIKNVNQQCQLKYLICNEKMYVYQLNICVCVCVCVCVWCVCVCVCVCVYVYLLACIRGIETVFCIRHYLF